MKEAKCEPPDLWCSPYCVKSQWQCDGQADCEQGEDEMDCKTIECNKEMFDCKDQHCIQWHQVCDGNQDCLQATGK